MSTIIDGVDQRTNLAGANRLELLLFRLAGPQLYGINVFKIREAIPCPRLTQLPGAHPVIRGITSVRGDTVSIVDLSSAIGRRPQSAPEQSFVILTEYNRSVQGFLVDSVDRIVNISWSDVHPPPPASGANTYMTAITRLDDVIVQIIDVEQVLAEVVGSRSDVSSSVMQRVEHHPHGHRHILVVDDSSVARNQIARTLSQIGVDVTLKTNGREALEQLQDWADQGLAIDRHIDLLISDIEMPEMDGYTLTAAIRADPRLKDLRVLLHTSMSGAFNSALVEKVGADHFLPKFSADELVEAVRTLIFDTPEQH